MSQFGGWFTKILLRDSSSETQLEQSEPRNVVISPTMASTLILNVRRLSTLSLSAKPDDDQSWTRSTTYETSDKDGHLLDEHRHTCSASAAIC